MMTADPSPDVLARVRARFEALFETAVDYPRFLIQELPTSPSDPALGAKIEEIGALAVLMNPIERADLCESIFRERKGLPRIPTRRMFDAGLKKAEAARIVTATEPGTAAAATKKRDPHKMLGHVFAAPDGRYYRESSVGAPERVSTFQIQPLEQIAREHGEKPSIRCTLIGPYAGLDEGLPGVPLTRTLVEECVLPARAWDGRRSMNACLPSNQCIVSGDDTAVLGILEQLNRDMGLETLPVIRSTEVLGRYRIPGTKGREGLRFVLPYGTIGPDGELMAKPDVVHLADAGGSLVDRLPKRHDAPGKVDTSEARRIGKLFFEHLYALHEPTAVARIAGWMMACLSAPELRETLSGAALLNVYGTTQAGKSSLVSGTLWRAFMGVVRSHGMSCAPTAFTDMRDLASANALCLLFEENKGDADPEKQKAHLRNLRRSYTQEAETRGQRHLAIRSYVFAALSCELGENRWEVDQALESRTVFVHLDARWLPAHPESRAAYALLRPEPLHLLGPWLHGWSLRDDTAARLVAARAMVARQCEQFGSTALETRLVDNLTWIVFGLLQIDAVAAELGATMPAVNVSAVVRSVVAEAWHRETTDDLANTDSRAKTSVDTWCGEACVAAQSRLIRQGEHYVWIDGVLFLAFSLIEPVLEVWRKARGVRSTGLTARSLNLQSEEMRSGAGSYVVGTRRRAAFDNETRPLCLAIDPTKIPASADIGEFPCDGMKTHGGKRKPLTAQELMDQFGKAGRRDTN